MNATYFILSLIAILLIPVPIASAQELHDAAEQGLLDEIRSIHSQGTDLNSRNDFDMTALHFAAYNGHKELVKFLLNNGALPNVQNKNGYTPFLLAIDAGHNDIASTLIQHDANINIHADLLDRHMNSAGKPYACLKRSTALSIALDRRDFETVKWLISYGADVNVDLDPVKGGIRCRGSGGTLFHKVIEIGDYDMVKLFLEHGADIHKKVQVYDPLSRRSAWLGPLELSRKNEAIINLLRSYGARNGFFDDAVNESMNDDDYWE